MSEPRERSFRIVRIPLPLMLSLDPKPPATLICIRLYYVVCMTVISRNIPSRTSVPIYPAEHPDDLIIPRLTHLSLCVKK
jgi:hypothetical protein